MEEDYLKKYQEAWQHDADELLDKVAPPMEELLSAVEHRERQRRRHLTAFISGIAAMMLVAVTLIFTSHPATQLSGTTETTFASVQQPAEGGHPTTVVMPDVQPQNTLEPELAIAVREPQISPAAKTMATNRATVSETLPLAQQPDGVAPSSNFEVAYLDDFYLDSTHSVPATVITARDSAAWEWLSTQFALAPEVVGNGSSQLVQRNYHPNTQAQVSMGLDIDTGSYLLRAMPGDHTIVVLHYEAVPDLLELRNQTYNYVEKDTQQTPHSQKTKQKLPKDDEKVPNRHDIRMKNPTYYQSITPTGQTQKGYLR